MSDEIKSESEKKKEDWMNSKWRPMMGWVYMLICITDMIIFPVLWSLLQTITHTTITQWNPLTLQGAGLFHIAMGAVLGIAAFGRTQEKLNGVNNGGLQQSIPSSNPSTSGVLTTNTVNPSNNYISTPTPNATTVNTNNLGQTAPGQIVTGFNGKAAPVQPPQPLI